MENYFTIKLFTEFYIPFVITAGFIVISILAILIALICNALENKFKNRIEKAEKLESRMEDHNGKEKSEKDSL